MVAEHDVHDNHHDPSQHGVDHRHHHGADDNHDHNHRPADNNHNGANKLEHVNHNDSGHSDHHHHNGTDYHDHHRPADNHHHNYHHDDNHHRPDDDNHHYHNHHNDLCSARGLSHCMHNKPPIRRLGESGAVLVETAVTIPVFLLLVASVMELGVMFRDYTALQGTTIEAVRAAVIAGNDFDADHRLLEVVEDVASPLPPDSIKQVIVFRADSWDSEVPPSCLTASQNTTTVRCNRYLDTSFGLLLDRFGCDDLTDLDQAWCPSDRVVIQAPANGGPPDYLGVHIVAERSTITGIFSRTQTLTSTKVLRIEPRDR